MAACFADCAGFLVEPFRSQQDALESLGHITEPEGAVASKWARAVALDSSGSAAWSVGEGELGQYVLATGIAVGIAAAQRAALTTARRLWYNASAALERLERSSGATVLAGEWSDRDE